MKIKFDIDVEKKIVRIFMKESEFEDWVRRGLKENPDLSTEELSHNGATMLSKVVGMALEKMGKIAGIDDLLSFRADPKMYKHRAEFPLALREMEI